MADTDTLEALIEEYEAAQDDYAVVKQRLEHCKTRLLSALVESVNTTRRRPLVLSERDFGTPFRRPELPHLGLYLHDEGFESCSSNLQGLLSESLSQAGVDATFCAADMCQCVLYMHRINSARATNWKDLLEQIQRRLNVDGKPLVLLGMKLKTSSSRATDPECLDHIIKGRLNGGPKTIYSVTFHYEESRDQSTRNYISTVTKDLMNERTLSALTQILLPLAVTQQTSHVQGLKPADIHVSSLRLSNHPHY
eukprot:GILK01012770.1.p1 GENE.GILK01012770.1~~GILK01012770.1.p1  ORF type:complete len:252 (-),score=23.28 GILK01012770.1:202-957(-)